MLKGNILVLQQYSFVESMKPADIIIENKSIPLFVFEYFMQKAIVFLIDETLEKSCLFQYSESDGLGITSALFS